MLPWRRAKTLNMWAFGEFLSKPLLWFSVSLTQQVCCKTAVLSLLDWLLNPSKHLRSPLVFKLHLTNSTGGFLVYVGLTRHFWLYDGVNWKWCLLSTNCTSKFEFCFAWASSRWYEIRKCWLAMWSQGIHQCFSGYMLQVFFFLLGGLWTLNKLNHIISIRTK